MSLRTLASVFPRQSPSSLILSSINVEADSPGTAFFMYASNSRALLAAVDGYARPRSRLVGRLGRPVGHFDAELPGVLGVQSLPSAELQGVCADDPSNRLSREEPLEDVETNVPSRGAPRDEAAVDVVPE